MSHRKCSPSCHRLIIKCTRRSLRVVFITISTNAKYDRDCRMSGRMIRSSSSCRRINRNFPSYDNGCDCRNHSGSRIPSLSNLTHYPRCHSSRDCLLDELHGIQRCSHGSMGRRLSGIDSNMEVIRGHILQDHGICRTYKRSTHGSMVRNSTFYHGIPGEYRTIFLDNLCKYCPSRRRSIRHHKGNF